MIKTPEQTSVKIIVWTCGRTHMVSHSKLKKIDLQKNEKGVYSLLWPFEKRLNSFIYT